MQTCDMHEDSIVIFTSRGCPACATSQQLEEAESDLRAALTRIDELSEELEEVKEGL